MLILAIGELMAMPSHDVRAVRIETGEGQSFIQEPKWKGITLIVGSAISLFHPTSLLSGQRLSAIIVEFLWSQSRVGYDEDLKKYILNIPFEYLCEYCPDRSKLRNILVSEFYPRAPNDIHKAIASLVRANLIKHIITTNYDTCLEELLPNGNPLKHVVIEEEARLLNDSDRVLFKIHGSASAEYQGSMVFSLRQEGVLADWKRAVLRKIVNNNVLLVVGYSGLDFEVCPEIPLASPAFVIWNDLGKGQYTRKQELFSVNAWRVLTRTEGVALLGDLRDLFSQLLGDQINPRITEVSSFSSNLRSSFDGKQAKIWSCSVLAYAGYGKQAEQISKTLLEDSTSEFDRAIALYFLAEAQFWMGKYMTSARNANKAEQLFLALEDKERFFDSVTREVDSLRCAGEFEKARGRIRDVRREILDHFPDASEAYLARLGIFEAMIIREYYLRAKSTGDMARVILLRDNAKSLLNNAASKMALLGRWYDLQTCRIWANRMEIPFEEVYNGPLQPLDDWFGFRHLGHAVVEMMAVRDSFWRSDTPLSDEIGLRNYIHKAIDIGCLPEVWKLTLTLRKHFGTKFSENLFLWLIPFLQCEYSLSMRLFKLRNEEHR